jgi:hypothetical protein
VAVVANVLHFRDPVDPTIFERAAHELGDPMRAIDGFAGLQVVHSGETEVVLLIFGETVEVLDRVATEVGSPWMLAEVVPLLASPPERHVGPVIAHAEG